VADAGVCAVVVLVRVSLHFLVLIGGFGSYLGEIGGRYEQVDQHFAGTRLGHIQINDFGRYLAGLVVHTCFVGAW
jgi:hypothetical protein